MNDITAEVTALYNEAVSLHQTGQLTTAVVRYQEVLKRQPNHFGALHMMGILAIQRGNSQEALRSIDQALTLNPQSVAALINRGLVLQDLQQPEGAIESFDKALALKPDSAEAYCNRGTVFYDLKNYDDAAANYQRAVVLRPDYFEALTNLGNCYRDMKRYDEAIICYERALELRPDDTTINHILDAVLQEQGRSAGVWHRRGIEALKAGRFAEALEELRRALRLTFAPNPELHNDLGVAQLSQRNFMEAATCFREALAINPDYFEAHVNLGTALRWGDCLDEAVSSLQEAIRLQPEAEVFYNLGCVLRAQGRHEASADAFRQALVLKPDHLRAYDNLLLSLIYSSNSAPDAIYQEHSGYGQCVETPLKSVSNPHTNECKPDRRLRIGYVSSNLRMHSVAFFLEPIFAHHERRDVEVYCYYNHTLQDEVTTRLRGYADHWIECKGMTDEQLATRIRVDAIDILVDLSGHMAGNRLPVFARKPAPVQVTYLGYPATTGLTTMNYRLATVDTDPLGADAWHSEQLYRLPRGLWCYRPPADMPAVEAETPARRSGRVTFGCMNNFIKISDASIKTWVRLLQAMPSAQLVLTNLASSAQRLMRERFVAHGIPLQRICLYGNLPASEFHALLSRIDIALDSFPYAGTTTTCESLWMGVPVVTLIGETSVARSGYALLRNIGLEELAARDVDEYVAIAVTLAQDLDRLEKLRGEMRVRIGSSLLRDEAGFTRDLEVAYRAMWRAWCRSAADS